ncbi:AzlD domain-containing protein [Phreatobacter aquaticus]|uniref:AzlD domain-containing protein n=1 Tax=Phreatobacter aquaticus TaxID=2570229 RepID=A0A4D7QLP7_9HYPH|nr:AzlD domain-containing protein [Phreatobacter aquaticus]QCK85182.1 AzlD domain-containing protein [Phreatobacter aquaticus]
MTDSASWTIAAIIAMALATFGVRIAGHWIMGRVPLTPFMRAALEALPGAIMMATVVPLAAKGGPSAWIGIAAAAIATLVFKRDLAALACGLGAVILARALGLA